MNSAGKTTKTAYKKKGRQSLALGLPEMNSYFLLQTGFSSFSYHTESRWIINSEISHNFAIECYFGLF